MARSFENAEDVESADLSVDETRDILSCAPSPEVLVTVLMRTVGLADEQLSQALNVSPSSIRSWRSGSRPKLASWSLLQDLGSLTAYLLSFECFTTPEAAGRWLSMPRIRDGEEPAWFVTGLEQVANGKISECAHDAYAMLAGPIDRRSLGGPSAQRGDPADAGPSKVTSNA